MNSAFTIFSPKVTAHKNFHRNEWTVIIHSSATAIQFSIQQFFKRTYALNKWAPLPMGNISYLAQEPIES